MKKAERDGAKIRRAREKRGITLRAFAKEIGFSSATLSRIETGKDSLTMKIAQKLNDRLGLHLKGKCSYCGKPW